MKKKVLFIISMLILLITLFLYYSNKSIEGLYIKNYEIFYTTDSSQDIYYEQNVFEIKNQKFNNYFYGSNGIPSSLNYFRIGKNVKLTSNENISLSDYSTVLKKNHKDSIVFNTHRNNGEVVFSRIPDSLKNNTQISLNERAFVLKFNKLVDTVYFDKNYLLIKDLNPTKYWGTGGWELLSINGFDIILTDHSYSFIYVIKEKNDKLFFYRFLSGNRILEIESFELKDYDLSQVKKIIDRLDQFDKE